MAKRVSIINFKGGVGKTTLAFNVAAGIVLERANRVLLVDIDHQSSLSVICLRAARWQEAVASSRTVSEVFRVFVGQRGEAVGKSIIHPNPLARINSDYEGLDVVPASLELDDIEIELTATHQGNAIQSEWNKRTLICQWLEESGVDDEYDLIIFDCPPATKIVSQNAIAASHCYVIPVVPEAVMERGAPHLVSMMKSGIDSKLKALMEFGEPRAMHVPDTELAGVAITQIQRASGGYTIEHRRYLESLKNLWGDKLLEPYIVRGAGVSAAVSDGIPVYERWQTQNVGERGIDEAYLELSNEIWHRIRNL